MTLLERENEVLRKHVEHFCEKTLEMTEVLSDTNNVIKAQIKEIHNLKKQLIECKRIAHNAIYMHNSLVGKLHQFDYQMLKQYRLKDGEYDVNKFIDFLSQLCDLLDVCQEAIE